MKKPKKEHPPQPTRDQFETEELYSGALRFWMDHHWRIQSVTEFLKKRKLTAVKVWKMLQEEERAHQETARELRTANREFSEWRKQAGEEQWARLREMQK